MVTDASEIKGAASPEEQENWTPRPGVTDPPAHVGKDFNDLHGKGALCSLCYAGLWSLNGKAYCRVCRL